MGAGQHVEYRALAAIRIACYGYDNLLHNLWTLIEPLKRKVRLGKQYLQKNLPQNGRYLHNHNFVRHSSAQRHFRAFNVHNERSGASATDNGYIHIRHQPHGQQSAPQAPPGFYGGQLDRLASFDC
jgi:hypothetical protein